MQIEKEFVPYKPSLDMKELGFDEPCFGFYYSNGKFIQIHTIGFPEDKKDCVLSPLYQQAFRWFRKKHGLHVIIDGEIRPQIKDSNSKLLFEYTKDGKYAGFEYEEAELECLKKLIEIVKRKK